MLEKIYETLRKIEVKGSLFEQAERLCEKEKDIKHLMSLCRKDELEELDDIRFGMIKLNDKVKECVGVLEEVLDVEVFVEHFKLDYDNYDDTEDFYNNLVASSTPIGHCIRMALIHKEKLVKDRCR